MGETVEMEVPNASLTNSVLAKLFRSVEKKGAVPLNEPTGIAQDSKTDIEGTISARRSSRIVRPHSYAPSVVSYTPPEPLRELSA